MKKQWQKDDKDWRKMYRTYAEMIKNSTVLEIRTTESQRKMTQLDFQHVEAHIADLLDSSLTTTTGIKVGRSGMTYSCIWLEVKNSKTEELLKNNIHLIPKRAGEDYSYIISSEKPHRIVSAFVPVCLWKSADNLQQRIKSWTNTLHRNEQTTETDHHISLMEGGKDYAKECKHQDGSFKLYFKITLEIDEEGIQKLIDTEELDRVGKIAVSPMSWISVQGSGVETMIRRKRLENKKAALAAQQAAQKTTNNKTKKPRKTTNTTKKKKGSKQNKTTSPSNQQTNNGSK